jgi:hypothetical protein
MKDNIPPLDMLPIGTKVKPWGAVAGYSWSMGERYYLFAEKGVALIPAKDVERMAKKQDKVRNV